MKGIEKAIKIFGNQNRMALALGVTRQAVHSWHTKKCKISPAKAIELSRLTKGKVRPFDVRPDIYPDRNWLPL